MIYVVEDDQNIRELECYALKSSGFDVQGFCDAKEFWLACEKALPTLVLLDIMLPKEDGLTILTGLRQQENTKLIPVMMVTAKTSELDRVKGLDLGADDYLIKPFGVMELVSRVKALLRRVQVQAKHEFSYGGILLNDDKHIVEANGNPCKLTYKEYELLKILLLNQGLVLSRDKIMEQVWGFDYEGESRTVDMHIKTLRQKLGPCGETIHTIRNVGYKLGD